MAIYSKQINIFQINKKNIQIHQKYRLFNKYCMLEQTYKQIKIIDKKGSTLNQTMNLNSSLNLKAFYLKDK